VSFVDNADILHTGNYKRDEVVITSFADFPTLNQQQKEVAALQQPPQ